ncbi:hypothetical protein D3C81_437100 [compost metagenome]
MNPPSELVAFMREMNCWETEFFDQRKKSLAEGVEFPQLKKNMQESLKKYLISMRLRTSITMGVS